MVFLDSPRVAKDAGEVETASNTVALVLAQGRCVVAPATEIDMEGSHQLYRLRKKHEIWCGGELDGSWLSSFDERFRGFKRKLA